LSGNVRCISTAHRHVDHIHNGTQLLRQRQPKNQCHLIRLSTVINTASIFLHPCRIFSRATEISCFAAETSRAAEFRFFCGNCQLSGNTLLSKCFAYQFSTSLYHNLQGGQHRIIYFAQFTQAANYTEISKRVKTVQYQLEWSMYYRLASTSNQYFLVC